MRDYAEQVKALRYCGDCDRQGCAKECKYGKEHPLNFRCIGFLLADAADAIEELLAASPPALWTDKPILLSEFMTHTGSVGYEIHFRTPDMEKYKAVQEECRRQIDHAKPAPPTEPKVVE